MKKLIWLFLFGSLLLALSCGGGGGSSSGGGSSANLNGTWSGSWHDRFGNSGGISTTVNQSGSSFTGTVVISNSPCFLAGTISGSVSGNNINFTAPYGNFSGTFTDTSISGTFNVTSGSCTGDTGTFNVQK